MKADKHKGGNRAQRTSNEIVTEKAENFRLKFLRSVHP